MFAFILGTRIFYLTIIILKNNSLQINRIVICINTLGPITILNVQFAKINMFHLILSYPTEYSHINTYTLQFDRIC